MTPILYTLTTLLNPWRTIRRLKAENLKLDAQAGVLHSLLVTDRAKAEMQQRGHESCRSIGMREGTCPDSEICWTDMLPCSHYENQRLRRCPTHGQQPPNAWGCPECVRELLQDFVDAQRQLATAREALQRVDRWGAFRGVLPDVNAWIQSGMTGPLPPLPEYLAKWEQADAGEAP